MSETISRLSRQPRNAFLLSRNVSCGFGALFMQPLEITFDCIYLVQVAGNLNFLA